MSPHGWAIGQRVRNEAEPSLGLGIVEALPSAWSIRVRFPGAGTARTYNPQSAPLRRYALGVGQAAETRDGRSFKVERIAESPEGLLTYFGEGQAAPEQELSDLSASNDPLQRLLAGELSDHEAFDLRARGWKLRSEMLSRRSRGLMGARVALLPHQLAIAHKIASRELPRVLLADEVGLGKTIEACLVFSALRALGRANRVLVLTPPSLVHQWLVELYRRFNALFTVVPDTLSGRPPAETDSPFEDASHLIVSMDWLLEEGRLEQALAQPWDLVIVDEAHHLGWMPDAASPAYAAVEALSGISQGLLLLTATPLRQGLETEFGLLRLVDPERFTDFSHFHAEHAHLREVAELARRLDAGEGVSAELKRRYPEGHWEGSRETALQQLVDRHGTGRVLVRNRRDKLGGFPGRRLHLSALPLPESWKAATRWPEIVALRHALGKAAPGQEPPLAEDPRWAWVADLVHALGDRKVLVMASDLPRVRALEKVLRKRGGLKLALFHEELSLVERDRQAAYFADPEGARVLLSTEIGGEGRNFQFCHHLVLADLPLHPDALEQRIGRLDRIGQTETIQVHVPVVEGTPGEALFRWHWALGVFDAPLTGGEALLDAQAPRLLEVLEAHVPGRSGDLDAFLQETVALAAHQKAEAQAGVDFLIDLNSFDQRLGTSLTAEIEGFDTGRLADTVSDLLEHFGVVEEDMAEPELRRIRPGDLMKVEAFPGLRDDGYLATYDRPLALAREDVQFLSPDHPLVEGAFGLLLDQAEGRASFAVWPEAPERGLRVEFLFLLEAVGPERLTLPRFLPPISLTVTLDAEGGEQPPLREEGARLKRSGPQLWMRLAGALSEVLPPLLDTAEEAANAQLRPAVEAAVAQAVSVLGSEQERLEELHALGNVPRAELAKHAAKLDETLHVLKEARVSLDAVRVVLMEPQLRS